MLALQKCYFRFYSDGVNEIGTGFPTENVVSGFSKLGILMLVILLSGVLLLFT